MLDIVRQALKGRSRQIVLTGAPGTGKTFAARTVIEELTDNEALGGTRSRFVQFHSSYDYTDFVEGLRPIPDGDKDNVFVRTDGTFKGFCREIVQANLKEAGKDVRSDLPDEEGKKAAGWNGEKLYYFLIDEINRADLGRVFGELMFCLEESYRGVRIYTQYQNLPVTYHRKPDGTLEKIEPEQDVFAKGFFIPGNLVILATMNDIDRSVETFDFALRRRFRWVNIAAKDVMFQSLRAIWGKAAKKANVQEPSLWQIIQKEKRILDMNEKVSSQESGVQLTEYYHLGPSVFEDFWTEAGEQITWEERVKPMLLEYVRGYGDETVQDFLTTCHDALLDPDSTSNS